MENKQFLIAELILLFIFIPFVLLLSIPVHLKVGTLLLGVVYVLVLTFKNKLLSRKSLYSWPVKSYWKFVLIRFLLLVLFSVSSMYIFSPDKLFIVIKTNFLFWVMLSVFYSIFSVYPQEFLYRSFFFARYGKLIKNPIMLITVNAVVFSLAHVGFKNSLVLALTLVGGVVFAITYYRTKSLLFTSIEHAIYGSWLFTVGAGEMLAFPMPT